jgi:hypoxanthine phosphoribosyltransferase
MNKDVKVLISEKELAHIVSRLAGEITKKHEGHEIVLLGILKGSYVFLADLARKIDLPNPNIEIDFLSVSSYGSGYQSSGEVKIFQDTKIDLEGKYVIIVEDIIDTGNTLIELLKIFKKRNPASLEICVLLDKKKARKKEINLGYVGMKVLLEFLVGYGLDYNQKYRNLPYVGILDSKVYQKK